MLRNAFGNQAIMGMSQWDAMIGCVQYKQVCTWDSTWCRPSVPFLKTRGQEPPKSVVLIDTRAALMRIPTTSAIVQTAFDRVHVPSTAHAALMIQLYGRLRVMRDSCRWAKEGAR